MNNYALTVLIKPDLEENVRQELLGTVKKKISGNDKKTNSAEGSLVKEDLWGNRELAYPIKKQQKAFYAHFEFEANPGDISSLDKSLKLEEDIIRYLLVRV